jgi:hypothetical protein
MPYNLTKTNIWIGYSSLQLALGICFSVQYLPKGSFCRITRKSNRFCFVVLGRTRVYHYNQWNAILTFIYIVLSNSTLWIPGISPTSCSSLEKLALRYLYYLGRVRFYDDGMAGFVENTFTWFHTLKIIPSATGHATWNQSQRSPLFSNSLQVDVSLLKSIEPGLKSYRVSDGLDYSIFIEANAMNITKLYSSFVDSCSTSREHLYFAHTDKASVSRQFESSALDQSTPNYHKFYSHEYHMLESLMMQIVDSSKSLKVYTGCTSTLLIILLYASSTQNICKLRVYYSPDYHLLHPDKIPQSRSFYDYIEAVYPAQCVKL